MCLNERQPDPLNELLAAARWPEVGAERLARLEQSWAKQQALLPALPRVRRWSRVAIRLVAISAAVLLAVGIVWWTSRGGNDLPLIEERGNEIARDETRPAPVERPIPRRPDAAVLASLTNSRPPTELETAMFRVWESRQRKAAWQQDDAVEKAIAAIRNREAIDEAQIAAAARPLLSRRAYSERRLLESALYFDGSRRDAALRLLAFVGTNHSVRGLLPLVENERVKSAAVATLLRIVPAERLAARAQRERNLHVQRTMLSALVIAGDERSIGTFLDCTAHRTTRAAALQVVAAAERLPTAAFLGWLRSSHATRSAASAAALAHAHDPAAIEAVVALAQSRNAPPSALVALVGSEQPAARTFVAAAQQSPLVAAINEAQYQWRVLASADLTNL
jgi:hypothetical protein